MNRAATAWLIRRFVDPGAEIRFVDPEDVSAVQQSESAIGFDAPDATYPHRDARGRCSFEALAEEHRPDDAALQELGRIVHGADFAHEVNLTPESAGLRAISHGFPLVAADDREVVDKASFIYDALYAALLERPGGFVRDAQPRPPMRANTASGESAPPADSKLRVARPSAIS